jgi:hypothetical protein
MSFGYVLVTLSASNSTSCIIIREKIDSEPIVTYRRTAETNGSSPSGFTARASRIPAMVSLTESGIDVSRTRISIDRTFTKKLLTSRLRRSVVPTLDSSLAGSFIAPASNSAAAARKDKLFSYGRKLIGMKNPIKGYQRLTA